MNLNEYITADEALNVLKAKDAGCDDNGNAYLTIEDVKYVMVDGVLHTLNDPDGWAEPDYPVKKSAFKEFRFLAVDAAKVPKVKFMDWLCTVVKSKYRNNSRIALELVDSGDGEPIATATTNIPDVHLAENEVCIKNYSENEGIYDVLVSAGIISPAKRYVGSGHVDNIPVCDCLI